MIVDYSTLQQRIASWLARSDLASAIPDFIQLAESRINRDLVVRERMREVSGESADGVIPVPGDLDRINALKVQHAAQWVKIDGLPDAAVTRHSGFPGGYVVINGDIRLDGRDSEYLLSYLARVPRLTDANPTNWLLTKEPGLYLYGALIESAPFLKDDARVATWGSQYQMIIDGMGKADDYARFGNAPAMRIQGYAP